jgi:hypothetical protein
LGMIQRSFSEKFSDQMKESTPNFAFMCSSFFLGSVCAAAARVAGDRRHTCSLYGD